MEAPEKLYVDTNENLSDSILYGFTEKRKDDDIEYIRKDAFIDKACEWLRKGGSGWYLTTEFGENEIDFVKLAEDFRKAMEG